MNRIGRQRLGLGFVPEDRRVHRPDGDGVWRSALRRRVISRMAPTCRGRRSACLRCFQSGEMPKRPAARMSGGEQQMLTVARTLMGNPIWCLTSRAKALPRSSSSRWCR
jgi:branched-chain amino acid transport system ATP-binding protein